MQPCDWIEHDYANKYVIDVYGRNEEQECIMLRIQGFKPYLYVKGSDVDAIRKTIGLPGIYTIQDKYDVFEGYNDFKSVKVCKIQVDSIKEYRQLVKTLKELKREVRIYEANLPPMLRFYHDHEISPASPMSYIVTAKLKNEEGPRSWTVNAQNIRSDPSRDIPLLISAYDIECMSKSGQFPVPLKDWSYVVEKIAKDLDEAPEDETFTQVIQNRITLEGGLLRPVNIEAFVRTHRVIIEAGNWGALARELERTCGPIGDPVIQIGITLRWSNNMLTNVKRRVFVVGGVTKHVEYVSFPTEADMIEGFMQFIQEENPDVICGYNTYGFDDNFLATRAKANSIRINLARGPVWGDDPLDHKTFELASGKYSVNYIRTPGRLTIDLLLNMRREHNLDSYTLDNVASTFLRDKVVKCEGKVIHTKTTRGLCVGNFIRLDVVGNTINPYMDGKKFLVTALTTKTITLEEAIEATDGLEWSFTKDDIHPHDLFRMHEGTNEDRATIAKYCIQDCDLVLTLMAKLDTLSNARGMADVCFVPLQFLFLRGQGIKIFSRVAYEASKRHQVLLTQDSFDGDTGYEGAIVISPKIGMYLDTPVAVLDFNSLYPSSMIGENLSPDTFVCMKTYNAAGKLIEYEGIAPEKVKTIPNCHEISYDVKDDDGKIVGRSTCVYVQPTPDNPLSVGLIPTSLEIMLKKRKEARKKMEDPTMDDAQKSVYNGLQLAYKVVANSIYGQLGSKTSAIRKICVAACTTAVGRRQLLFAKETVEKEFGAEVVYGDSVAKYTPVIVRIHGTIHIVRIDQLDAYGRGWRSMEGGKESCELENVESWTEAGWTPLSCIIRHGLQPTKKMFRILTHSGVVDVTDDHSLIRKDGTPASSKDTAVGDELLHHEYPEITTDVSEMTIEEARIAGFFSGDGSCGMYDCPSGKKAGWALNNADHALLEYYKGLCENVYPELSWNILNTIESSGVYKLSPTSNKQYGKLVEFITAYRASMYTETKEKKIPASVLNGSFEVRESFWKGLYDADGDKNGINVRIDQKSQLSSAHIMYLGASLGYKVSVTDRESKEHIYRITCTKSHQRKNVDAIKRIREIEYDGFVYDLTTKNHHFQAGVGKMIVHNTDSIFIKYPSKTLVETIKLAQDSADLITKRCPHKAFVIGYEKTFYPFILFCRKRYVGMKYEEDPTKCKRASMGVVLKRRDNAPIVKDVFGGALDILLVDKDVKKAVEFVKTMLLKVVKGELPIDKFAITKQLRDDYKAMKEGYEGTATIPAHRILADRMAARDPGNKPNVGDRLKFVYIQAPEKRLQCDKIEHIAYAAEKKLPLDTLFYVTNQIQNPVAQLFALCIEDIPGYRSMSIGKKKQTYDQLYEEYMETFDDHEQATLKVLAHKEKQLDGMLFLGAEYIQNTVRRSRTGPLDAFFRPAAVTSAKK